MYSCNREDTSKLKEGEQEKTKDYSALIWSADVVTQEMLDAFNKIEVKFSSNTTII